MAEAHDKRRESTTLHETTGVPQDQQQDGKRHHGQQQQEAPSKLEDTDQGLQRMELKKFVSLLASIFDQIFVKPQSRYDLRVKSNNTAFIIFKVKKSLFITEKANKVAEVIQAKKQSAQNLSR